MNSRPFSSKWPTSPRGHQPVDLLLAAAAGVALELRRVADEDPAGLALGQLACLVVEDLDHRRRGRPCRPMPGSASRSVGRGDRRVGDLGRAVQVVDHRPERLQRALGQLTPSAEPLTKMIRRCDRSRSAISSSPRSSDPLQHHRHHDHRGGLVAPRGCRASPRDRSGGARPASSRAPIPHHACMKPSAWNIGTAQLGRPRRRGTGPC